jgi:CAAX prenyl protease-like protein
MPKRRKLIAYVAPMVVFVVLLSCTALLKKMGHQFWLQSPEYWVFPVQTILCGALLLWFWREYDFGRLRNVGIVVAIAVAVFLIWISPQQFFRAPARSSGFNPDIFIGQPALYWPTIILRLLRLVVVVPLVEEIFWRGFLLRYLIDEDFERVPFGAFSWVSFIVVAALFGFSHSPEDWVAAVITGACYNIVAYRTKSLVSCVLTHAITNLLLGVWIVQTKQWGFW